jgi:DNA polymerase III subunit delta'
VAREVEQAADASPAAPAPRANPDLVGHESVEAELRRLEEAGRLPHAILLTGPRGTGKATLAFRLARFLFANERHSAAPAAERGLGIDPQSGVFHRVAAGGHADLLTIERAYDPRRRRLRGEIVVDDTREVTNFFRLTAAEGGWRIVIIDGAEEMNRNAANALLKVLEDPPRQALLLVISHSPGRLLPTIRSRCRRFVLAPLTSTLVTQLLERYRPELAQLEVAALAALSDGSIGRALDLADADGLALYRSMLEMLSQGPPIDVVRLHAFADQLARADAEDAYRASGELLLQLLARVTARSVGRRFDGSEIVGGESAAILRLAARADAAHWARLREDIQSTFARTDQLNLDRKQALLGAFFAIEELARLRNLH